jgi:L-fucose isomerase-like protein
MKHAGRIFHLGEDGSGCTQLRSALGTLEVSRKMEKERIGVIGIPSDWLVASVPSSKVVKDVWGSTLVHVPLEELFHEMRYISTADILSSSRAFFHDAHASTVQEMSVVDAMKVYTGLRRIIERHRLTSLTVRCFDIVEKLHTTGCVALSQLTDEGIVAGCEVCHDKHTYEGTQNATKILFRHDCPFFHS